MTDLAQALFNARCSRSASMNRLILKHGTLVTIVILAVFAWVIYRRVAGGGVDAIILLAVTVDEHLVVQ